MTHKYYCATSVLGLLKTSPLPDRGKIFVDKLNIEALYSI